VQAQRGGEFIKDDIRLKSQEAVLRDDRIWEHLDCSAHEAGNLRRDVDNLWSIRADRFENVFDNLAR
jgi:hypothetical protein